MTTAEIIERAREKALLDCAHGCPQADALALVEALAERVAEMERDAVRRRDFMYGVEPLEVR